jgi:tetratricopeptide (TPR) repeat protein
LAFYRGENAAARRCLQEYAADTKRFLGLAVGSRAKLQLSEYFYSLRQFDHASEVATAVADECDTDNNDWGLGEASYYIARAHARLDEIEAVQEHCHVALEKFSQAALKTEMPTARVHWRIGRVLTVAGWTHWRAGQLAKARSKLSVARLLLRQTGDFIGIADAEHSLGVILRSQGDYEESARLLANARAHYQHASHQGSLARVATSIARTCLDAGDVAAAKQHLEEALEICNRTICFRQKAEVLVWLSWLHLRPAAYDVMKAERAAHEALKLAASRDVASRRLQVEARLALGYCRASLQDYDGAEKCFEVAREDAATLRVPKLIASACLSLAELYCTRPVKNFRLAWHYYEEAERSVSGAGRRFGTTHGVRTSKSHKIDCSHYLSEQAARVRQILREADNEVFLVTVDDLADARLGDLQRRLQSWGVEKALAQARGRKVDAAKLLKLSRQGFDKIYRRANAGHDSNEDTEE